MYDYDLYDYSAGVSTTSSIGTFPLIGGSLASILIIVSLWKIFQKAGKPGMGFYSTNIQYDSTIRNHRITIMVYSTILYTIC